jgi:hypothetical protein
LFLIDEFFYIVIDFCRIMEEMKNVAETYKICESSETHTSQNISCMSVAEL